MSTSGQSTSTELASSVSQLSIEEKKVVVEEKKQVFEEEKKVVDEKQKNILSSLVIQFPEKQEGLKGLPKINPPFLKFKTTGSKRSTLEYLNYFKQDAPEIEDINGDEDE